jgi:hypothetical protein
MQPYSGLIQNSPQDRGFIIEKQWQAFIVHRARNDKLMSAADYADACEENHNLALSHED